MLRVRFQRNNAQPPVPAWARSLSVPWDRVIGEFVYLEIGSAGICEHKGWFDALY